MHVAMTLAEVDGSTGEPAVFAALERVEARLARIEATLDKAGDAVAAMPPAIGILTDTFDDAVRKAEDAGIDLGARLREALQLFEQITRPDVMRAFAHLVSGADALQGIVSLAQQAPAALAMATDTMDAMAQRLSASGIDLDERGKNLLLALDQLTSPRALEMLQILLGAGDALRGLAQSGVLDAEPLAVVSSAGEALACSGREAPAGVGFFGLMRALREPSVQRALGFAVRFARHFGNSLGDGPRPARQLPIGRQT